MRHAIINSTILVISSVMPSVLRAQEQDRADDSMKTDNPYIAVVLVFCISLAVAIALIRWLEPKRRGRIIIGIIFGIVDWLIAVPLCLAAGVSTPLSLAMASVSAGIIVFLLICYGKTMASWFGKHESPYWEDDERPFRRKRD